MDSEIIRTTCLGLFFGTIGTTIGGIIGVTIKGSSNKFLGFMLSFSAGLMMSIICFDLIPEAIEVSGIITLILGILFGIFMMIICDNFVSKKLKSKIKNANSLLKTGIIVSIGLAIHNIPEGLAIGSGFDASLKLGINLALAICLHDVPEGISMALPMKNGGMKKGKVIYYVVLSGIATGIGSLVGAIVGGISEKIISFCLSFAAGCMLYIVSGELIPESNKLYKGRMNAIGNMLGFILGIFTMVIK